MPQRDKGFAWLWASQASSNVADGLVQAAVPLLAAALTRDPLVIAGVTVAQFLPRLLLTLWAGALTDRVDRRRILIIGNGMRAVVFILLAASVAAQWTNIWILYVLIFVAGTAETLVDNAAITVPPRLVPRERLERANGRLFATQSVVDTFVGPPIGAALFSIAASVAFFGSAAAFVFAAAAALLLPQLLPDRAVSTDSPQKPPSINGDIREGWAVFWNHRLLRSVAFVAASINFFGTATGALMVLIATEEFAVPPSMYGWFLAVPAAGAVVGALLAERVVPVIGGGPVTWAAALVPAGSFAVIALTDSVAVALVFMLLAAFATALNQIVVSTLRQAAVPDRLLGRVTAAYRLIVLGVVPLGALIGGVAAHWIGVRGVFLASAIGLGLAAIAFASRVTTRGLRDAELSVATNPSDVTPTVPHRG